MKKKKIILAVDDNPDLVYSVKVGLEALSKDYKVITAQSGRKCLQILEKSHPDIILLDIMMPQMDGWDTCAKIKDNKKTENIPIVFLTAKTDPVSTTMGKLASADYITKPFEISDLKKRIDSVLKAKDKK